MGAKFVSVRDDSYIHIKRGKDEKYLGILHTIWQCFSKFEGKKKKKEWLDLT